LDHRASLAHGKFRIGNARPNELIGSGFGFRRIDFDAAPKMGAVFDADSRASNVTSDRAVFCDFDAPPSMDIADDLAMDNYFAGANFRIELRCGADGSSLPPREIGPSTTPSICKSSEPVISPLICRLKPSRAKEWDAEIAACEGERVGAVKGVTVDADGCAVDGADVSVRVCGLDHIVHPLLNQER
jgi:hypothetical protein